LRSHDVSLEEPAWWRQSVSSGFFDHRIKLSLAAPEALTKRCLLDLFFGADVFVLNVLLAGEAGSSSAF